MDEKELRMWAEQRLGKQALQGLARVAEVDENVIRRSSKEDLLQLLLHEAPDLLAESRRIELEALAHR